MKAIGAFYIFAQSSSRAVISKDAHNWCDTYIILSSDLLPLFTHKPVHAFLLSRSLPSTLKKMFISNLKIMRYTIVDQSFGQVLICLKFSYVTEDMVSIYVFTRSQIVRYPQSVSNPFRHLLTTTCRRQSPNYFHHDATRRDVRVKVTQRCRQ